jgi:hypothetical protein
MPTETESTVRRRGESLLTQAERHQRARVAAQARRVADESRKLEVERLLYAELRAQHGAGEAA